MSFREPRRKQDRVRIIRTGVLAVGNTKFDCLVRDISGGGARLKLSDRNIGRGAQGSLTIPGVGKFAGEIIWKHGGELGMRFENTCTAAPSFAFEASNIADVLTVIAKG